MLKTHQIQYFLRTLSSSTDFSLSALLGAAAHLVEASLILVDSSGTPIYKPQSNIISITQDASIELPIQQAGHSLGKLIIYKNKLSPNEQLLLEMLQGLLLASLEFKTLSNNSLKKPA